MPKSSSIFIGIVLSMWAHHSNASVVIKGNSLNESTTFNFPIKKYVQSDRNNILYVAAQAQAGGQARVNEYALSQLLKQTETFIPLAPSAITLNITQNNQPNPLYDAGIKDLALLENASQGFELPALITQQKPNVVYVYESSLPNAVSLLESAPLHDANNQMTHQLTGLATDNDARIFTMTHPATGRFGQKGTGIAGLIRGTFDAETKLRVFQQIDLPTGRIVDAQQVRSLALDVSSEALTIGANNLSEINDVVSLHWDTVLQRLFIGLQVKTAFAPSSGARSVVVGRLHGNKMLLSPIAPDGVFDQLSDAVIGDLNNVDRPQTEVSVHALKTMHTSTGLTYLIVHGGNGNPQETQAKVYALPLVTGSTDALNGTIASTDALPNTVFVSGVAGTSFFSKRNLSKAATIADQLPRAGHAPVLVGGGNLEAGNITDIFVKDDALFAMVHNETDKQKSGVYYSQALFEATGTIKGWTPWQRAVGTTQSVFGAVINMPDASFSFITHDDTVSQEINTVKRTQWFEGNVDGLASVTSLIDLLYPQDKGGVTMCTLFNETTPGVGNRTLCAVGGDNTFTLIATGKIEDTIALPFGGKDFDLFALFDTGTITQPVNAHSVTFKGGALATLGPITAAEIIVNTSIGQAWLVVAGVHGAAILSSQNGAGWDVSQGIGHHFSALTPGMSFKKLGDYTMIKKLIADGDFLYILADTHLDRINSAQLNGGMGSIAPLTLVDRAMLGLPDRGGFLDLIVSDSLALLGTTQGLYRTGNNQSIAQDTVIRWTPVPLAEGLPAVTQLIAFSSTGRAQDVAKRVGGQVYVVNADQGNDQSTLNRLSIAGLGNGSVDDSTVLPFHDRVVKSQPSNFFNFGRFKKNVITDGAVYFATCDTSATQAQSVGLVPFIPQPQVGRPSMSLSINAIQDITGLGTIVESLQRNSASGSWLLTGNFGLRVNE